MLPAIVSPMLAQLEQRLPAGDQWRYEPKFDGFRGLLWHLDTGGVRLLSRNLRDLGPWFPELMQATRKLPDGTLLDGEIVMRPATLISAHCRVGWARASAAPHWTRRPAPRCCCASSWSPCTAAT